MNLQKKNILIPISFNFQVRYLIRSGLVEKLKTFCNPIILIFWKQEDLIDEIKSLGYEHILYVPEQPDVAYVSLKRKVDNYYWRKVLKSPTFKIKENRSWKGMSLKKKIRLIINLFREDLLLYDVKSYKRDIAQLDTLVKSSKDYSQLAKLLSQLKIQAIFTTAPFLYTEELACRIATKYNIPIFYSVLSFDNLTTRSYLPFTADHYFVWNNINKNELLRIYRSLLHEKISVTGPAQFDFYYQKQYIKEVGEWRKNKAIPSGRPIIMYGANAKVWVPNEYLIIKTIDEAINANRILHNPVILLRPHPTDSVTDWKEFAKTCKNVYIEKSIEKNQSEDRMFNKYSNFTINDVINLCSTLANSSVHISYASTLALDGACFNKPQICPYFAPKNSIFSDKEIRNLYHSEHYTPIRLSGAIDLPKNENELIDCINQALLYPELKSQERSKLLDQMITYQDGKATERIAAKLAQLVSKIS